MLRFQKQLIAVIGLSVACSCFLQAQTAAPTRKPQVPVVTARRPAAPQVITVLHRINGLTMLRMLIQSGERIGALENLDEAFQLKGVHTNIIAGLALDDGETIAAWLPEAEVEIESTLAFSGPAEPSAPAPSSPPVVISPRAPRAPRVVGPGFPSRMFTRPDITIIERDGRRRRASYVGLDGITGLSLLKLSEKNVAARSMVSEPPVIVGQRMRLFSPEPASETRATTTNSIYVRIGETDGQVVSVARGRSGEINRIRIKSTKLSPSNIGAVVVNETGQTIGIVESIEGSEANLLSPATIRAAAKRVLAQQASVPRPWLGVSGEPVALASLDRIVTRGWETQRAMSLLRGQRGILLNSVAPGSPADEADLRAGDVIVTVNDDDVRSTDDFSLLLAEAASKPVRFTVVRPTTQTPESVTVKLSQTLDSMFAPRMFSDRRQSLLQVNPLIDQGIETVPLRPLLSPMGGAVRGLLVIHIQSTSAALGAGLLPGDVIEAIDGKQVGSLLSEKLQLSSLGYVLSVLRGKEKLQLTVTEQK
jgi:S1-C subfamily serine protease